MAKALRGGDPKAAVPSKPKILIFGPPGTGKTTFACDFPSVYYIDSEGGADLEGYTDRLKASGAAYMGPRDGACDFPTVLEEIQTLATTKHRFKTLVIDSFSKLFETRVAIDAEAMERAGKEDGFGASKKGAVGLSRRMVSWFQRLDMNVVLICHQQAMYEGGKEVGVTFSGWPKLGYELHLALRVAKLGASRKAFVGKSRLKGFPEGESFDLDYATFAGRYGRDVMEAESKAAEVSTPEQMAEYHALLVEVKPAEDVLNKWEAACDDPASLERPAMEKRLEWLRKQRKPVAVPA